MKHLKIGTFEEKNASTTSILFPDITKTSSAGIISTVFDNELPFREPQNRRDTQNFVSYLIHLKRCSSFDKFRLLTFLQK
jgi:hypothetical protein